MCARFVGLLGVFSLVLTTGCGGGSASVTGKLTASGEPVTSGKVVFSPIGGGVKPAAGTLQTDGTFELKTSGDEGVWPAQYKVVYSPAPPGEEAQWERWTPSPETISIESGANDVLIEMIRN